jgi:dolichol-phosphate mannosyltransferase
MPELLVNAATYNERENLPELLDLIWQYEPTADVLIVDDNSPDGTGAWCAAQTQHEARLFCRVRSGKLGLASATILAFRFAIEHHYDWLLTLDADLSHPPRFIPALISACQPGTDLVIGSRYVPGGAIRNWPLYRRVGSRLINAYARWMLTLPPRDCSGAFRCYRVDALRQLDLEQFAASGYAFYEESLWHCAQAGFVMTEVPIEFVDRTRGASKIGVREAIKAVWQITNAGLRRH